MNFPERRAIGTASRRYFILLRYIRRLRIINTSLRRENRRIKKELEQSRLMARHYKSNALRYHINVQRLATRQLLMRRLALFLGIDLCDLKDIGEQATLAIRYDMRIAAKLNPKCWAILVVEDGAIGCTYIFFLGPTRHDLEQGESAANKPDMYPALLLRIGHRVHGPDWRPEGPYTLEAWSELMNTDVSEALTPGDAQAG